MSTPSRRPPSLAIHLLERSLPEPTRSEVVGDLLELLATERRGAAVRFWFRVLAFTAYFLAVRFATGLASVLRVLRQPGWADDVRYARKTLTRTPGFTLTALATLTLAVCAATTVSWIVMGILWRPMPYPEADALVLVDWLDASGHAEGSTLQQAEELRRHGTGFTAAGVFTSGQREMYANGAAELVSLSYVHSGTLAALGVQPVFGRSFDARHDQAGGDVHHAVVSHGLWQRRFGGDPDLARHQLRVGPQTLSIVGVMPAGFDFPRGTDVWIPVESFWASSGLNPRMRSDVRLYPLLARLAPGTSLEQVQLELDALRRGTAAHGTGTSERWQARVRSLRGVETAGLVVALRAIGAGTLGLLLVCCVNVASLQVARATRRRAEFLTRAALGASRGRLLRTQAVEGVLLCSSAGALGVWLSTLVLRVLASSGVLALPSWVRLQPDGTVWLFAAGATAVTAFIAIATPVWYLRRAQRGGVHRLSGRGGTPDRARVRHALVLAQVALSTTLVAGSLMLLESVRQLQGREVGIRTDRVLTVSVTRSSRGNRIQRSHALWGAHARVVERLAAIPGIEAASGGDRLPLTGAAEPRTTADLRVSGASGDRAAHALRFRAADVFPRYFETLGIPVLRGRSFDTSDSVDRAPVVIVNAHAAELLWPGRDPIGQQVTWGTPRPDNPAATVVGVVGNVRHAAWETEPGVEFYYAYAQYATDVTHYIIRTRDAAAASMAETIRKAVLEISPDTVVSNIRTMDEWRRESLAEHAIGSAVLSLLSGIALGLAVIGLYALVAYLASERATEFAIRTSLGATPRRLTRLVLASITRVVALGIGVGLAGTFGLAQLLRTWLFGIAPGDPHLVIGTCLVMAVVAMAATLYPAVRAGHTNPSQLFR